jgi:hypothetical protein
LTAPYRHRLHRVGLLLGGVNEQVVNGGRIGAAGAYQCYGTKSINNVPGDAGNLQRSSTAVVNLEWSSTAVVDFKRSCASVVNLEWPGTAVVDLKWSCTAVVNLKRSSATLVEDEYPVKASQKTATSGF